MLFRVLKTSPKFFPPSKTQENPKFRLKSKNTMPKFSKLAKAGSIENNIRLQCKCHGVSGSCELRTCWRTMPPFREIGQILKDKFDGATETKLAAPLGAHGPGSNSPRKGLVPVNLSFKPHTAEDLVYLTPSPSYCTYDNETETHGTHGRICNRTSKAIDGCELLCCGRGYVTKMEKRIERCQCKFHWCCYVKCKECEIMEEVSTCL
uniref:Protein Wnt n=1 Tax=Romanomermis culicivorax TaxID=13658 RepID=A0A915ID16_ROMCU